MNHSFQGAGDNCTKCKQNQIAHTDAATCECCDNIGPVELMYGNMLMCSACVEKEKAIQAENMKPENQKARMNEMIIRARDIDSTIQIKTDIFNAATVPMLEIKAAIEADDSISNKDYAYADELYRHVMHLKEVISGKREELKQKENEQRAFQVNLQQVVGKLSAELRAKFKEADLSYQPTSPKAIKPSAPKAGSKKFQKEEVRKVAGQYNIPEAVIQMIVVAKNLTPEWAAKHFTSTSNAEKCECPACKKVS